MKTSIFVFLLCFSTSLFAANLPVTWTSEVKLNSVQSIPSLLTKQVEPVKYVNDKNQTAIASTCNDYFTLTKMGYSPADNTEIAKESFYKKTCEPLVTISNAQPAKISFIRNFSLKQDYKMLPASIIFPSLSGEETPYDLKTVYPDVQVLKASNTSATLISRNADMESNVSILAFGDFNKDGYDDMLIFVAHHLVGGTYHSYDTYLLTRKSENGALIIIKLQNA